MQEDAGEAGGAVGGGVPEQDVGPEQPEVPGQGGQVGRVGRGGRLQGALRRAQGRDSLRHLQQGGLPL